MKWRLFTILSALSLVLWVTFAVLPVRSIWRSDDIHHNLFDPVSRTIGQDNLYCSGGHLGYQGYRYQMTPAEWQDALSRPASYRAHAHRDVWRYAVDSDTSNTWRGWLLYELDGTGTGPWWLGRANSVEIPLWPLIVLTGILPSIWFWRAYQLRRRRRLCLCLTCGYDLRAHAAGQRCPECGWSIPADFPRPNSGAVEQAKDGRDVPAQA